jgi:hypothetical protein
MGVVVIEVAARAEVAALAMRAVEISMGTGVVIEKRGWTEEAREARAQTEEVVQVEIVEGDIKMIGRTMPVLVPHSRQDKIRMGSRTKNHDRYDHCAEQIFRLCAGHSYARWSCPAKRHAKRNRHC